jgi:hypothetical protein
MGALSDVEKPPRTISSRIRGLAALRHKPGRAHGEILEVPSVGHGDLQPPPVRLFHKHPRIRGQGRSGLVHQHMRPRPERRLGVPEMYRVRQGDHHPNGPLRRQHHPDI